MMMPPPDNARRGAANAPGMGPPGGQMGMRPGQMMQMSMPPGMNVGSAGTGGLADMGADVQLFRYFDFDVEPGECYRYRVKLIVDNPSLDETFVSQPTVAEGKFRETPWSAPSPPAVVERDVEYGLVKVPNTRGRVDGAELSVVQYDSNLGSHIMEAFKVYFGSYVGTGTKKKRTLHLDFSGPSFKEEDVSFSSNDLLLDSAGGPSVFSPSAQSDLNLTDPNKVKKLTRDGGLDMAVTFNRFGEIIELDAGSLKELESAKERVKEEREPYKDIMETDKDKKKKDAKEAGSSLDIPGADTGKGKGKKKEKAGNPLKTGASQMESMRGMMMPPPATGSSGRRGGRSSR
jgi:hypothetical protein